MPPQTLQNIENGKTKSLTLNARRLLAPVLQVREDQLMLPVGFPVPPLEGEETPEPDAMAAVLEQMKILAEAQTPKLILDELREMRRLLERIAARLDPPAPAAEKKTALIHNGTLHDAEFEI